LPVFSFFFFLHPSLLSIYSLSLHDALPIFSSFRFNCFRACVLLNTLPAPCEQDWKELGLPFPVTKNDDVPCEPGIIPHSPSLARVAPFRCTMCSSPKCSSKSAKL